VGEIYALIILIVISYLIPDNDYKIIIRRIYLYAQGSIFQKHFVIYFIFLFSPIESSLDANSLFAVTNLMPSSTTVALVSKSNFIA